MDFTLDQKHEMARDLFKQFAETAGKAGGYCCAKQRAAGYITAKL